jgi:hypothetical protein
MGLPPKTPFEKWKDTINAARSDSSWNEYDNIIQQTVSAYNTHLAESPAFTRLDWKVIKAMVWTESGGPSNPAWKARPMQIGNQGDPGLDALLSGNEGGDLVTPPSIRNDLTIQNAASQPEKNIQAGVGFLLMRAARFGFVNTEDSTDKVHEYTVEQGDTFTSIADKNGSTVQELKFLNPAILPTKLQVGKRLKIRKARIRKTITGFTKLNTETVARLYNIRDDRYADKLNYCLGIIGKQ